MEITPIEVKGAVQGKMCFIIDLSQPGAVELMERLEATISYLQEEVYKWAKSKGWCDREVAIPEQVALIHSEVSEALEAWRNKEPISWFDEEGKPQGIASEYADIIIRVLHYSALLNINLEEEIKKKMAYNQKRPYKHGGKAG